MIPVSAEELANCDLQEVIKMKIPEDLSDSLIGEEIEGTPYFRTLEGDPTKSGYITLNAGTPVERKVYKTLHIPTGSNVTYRKLNHLVHGDCWEVVPNEDDSELVDELEA